ncbi:MAG: mechanosensitive ion channel domain-containing protein [Rhodanobacter sp.]
MALLATFIATYHASAAATAALAARLNESSARPWDDWLDTKILDSRDFSLTLGSLSAALLVFVSFVVLSLLLQRVLRRYARRNEHVSPSSVYTVGRLLHYLLLLIGLLVALSYTGIPMARFAVFAGALGVGLGFGLQAIFNNFVCGLILLFDRSLKVNDFVDLASGVHGRVRDIHIRATRITTNDDIDILVPNSEFVNGRVVNWTVREGHRRLKVPFHVAYGSDKERVQQAVLEAANAVPFTLTGEGTKPPEVRLIAFGDWAMKFQLVVWLTGDATRRPGAAQAAYNWAIHSALQAHDIVIPLPQSEVHLSRAAAELPTP